MTTSLNAQVSQPDVRLRLLTMREVADRLGVSLQRVYEMGRCGLLPVVRLGRQMRVEEGRLLTWIHSGGLLCPAAGDEIRIEGADED